MNLPDITPTKTDDRTVGRVHAFQEQDLGGFPYFLFGIIREDGTLGLVKVGKRTYETSAFRNASEAFRESPDQAVALGLCISFSRGKESPSGYPYWNIDRVRSGEDTKYPMEPTNGKVVPHVAAPAPATAPAAPQAPATPAPRSTVDERYDTYMTMLARVIKDLRTAEDCVINVDANAVAFSILKGW